MSDYKNRRRATEANALFMGVLSSLLLLVILLVGSYFILSESESPKVFHSPNKGDCK